MAYIISDNITSPLGGSTSENMDSLRRGESKISHYGAEEIGVNGDCEASLSSNYTSAQNDGLTPFERISLHSITQALEGCTSNVETSSRRTVLIISTTKGNVEGIFHKGERILPTESAHVIAERIGVTTMPIVVCDACISGLAALITADRLLSQGSYDTAIVCGADVPRKFIIAGFQSLQALSAEECRPFDMERNGLNLGEAAATVIMAASPTEGVRRWGIGGNAIRNDAFHLCAPHKKGEGLFLAIKQATKDLDAKAIGLINAHGTATLFNDQMESVAIERAGLGGVPVNGLKGFYGHTMGAAGILETIVSTHTLDEGYALPTRGFGELGVSGRINVLAKETALQGDGKSLLKIMSGFGGCNAAAIISKEVHNEGKYRQVAEVRRDHRVVITPDEAVVDGRRLDIERGEDECGILLKIYKKEIGGYVRFYKMDELSRLGFVASELLLRQEAGCERFVKRDDRAVVIFNRTSSIDMDARFTNSVAGDEPFSTPSPSQFIRTLPNIVTGEIAIRNNYHGETSLYMLADKDEQMMQEIIKATFADSGTRSLIAGWVDYENDDSFEADISIYFAE